MSMPMTQTGAAVCKIGFGDVAAFDEIHVIEFRHLRSPGAKVGVFQGVQAAANFDASAEGGADFLAGSCNFADGCRSRRK